MQLIRPHLTLPHPIPPSQATSTAERYKADADRASADLSSANERIAVFESDAAKAVEREAELRGEIETVTGNLHASQEAAKKASEEHE